MSDKTDMEDLLPIVTRKYYRVRCANPSAKAHWLDLEDVDFPPNPKTAEAGFLSSA